MKKKDLDQEVSSTEEYSADEPKGDSFSRNNSGRDDSDVEEYNADEFSADEFNEEELARSQAYWSADDEKQKGDEVETANFELSADESLSEGTELEAFESAEIEETEFIEDERVESIIESLLFSTDKALSVSAIKQAFTGTNVKTDKIRRALENLSVEYAGAKRGVSLEEVQGGYQLRTKVDNTNYLKQLHKARPFRLSGPALEVLAIVAYKQPMVKNEVDQIRGVESGHLMRALMDRRLIQFVGKSDLPGKPMLYGTTRTFLQIFGLRNIGELPSLNEIDQLIPEGIGEDKSEEKENLADVSQQMGLEQGQSYSESEEELSKITEKLQEIDTTTAFFEEEKRREKERREAEKAKEIQEALDFGEEVSTRDRNWLDRYLQEQAKAAEEASAAAAAGDDDASGDASGAVVSASRDGADVGDARDEVAMVGELGDTVDAAIGLGVDGVDAGEEVAMVGELSDAVEASDALDAPVAEAVDAGEALDNEEKVAMVAEDDLAGSAAAQADAESEAALTENINTIDFVEAESSEGDLEVFDFDSEQKDV